MGAAPYRGAPIRTCTTPATGPDSLDAYIRHALTCPTCTAAARLPGAERCPAGAVLWAIYLAELPTESKTETDRDQTEPDNLPSGVSES